MEAVQPIQLVFERATTRHPQRPSLRWWVRQDGRVRSWHRTEDEAGAAALRRAHRWASDAQDAVVVRASDGARWRVTAGTAQASCLAASQDRLAACDEARAARVERDCGGEAGAARLRARAAEARALADQVRADALGGPAE